MKKRFSMFIAAIIAITMLGSASAFAKAQDPKTIQNVQVFEVSNKDGKITPKTIEAAFDSLGLIVGGNNNMNNPFMFRFKANHYKTYNLAVFHNADLTLKLIKKYHNFGALSPLTMSIWSDDEKKTMKVATLTTYGMARSGSMPVDDADLVAYSALIEKALKKAMPGGKFVEMNHVNQYPEKSFATDWVVEIDEDEAADPEEYKENFQAEFEGEMEPIGFLFPNYINMKEEIFDEAGYDEFDFYDTYSICKFDVIFPVSKHFPEAGAWAPCSFYMYKKKGENEMHLGFLSVDNWIKTLDMNDEKDQGVIKLREAQKMIEDIINEIVE